MSTEQAPGLMLSHILLPKWEDHYSAEDWKNSIYEIFSTSERLEEAMQGTIGQQYLDLIEDPSTKPRDVNIMVFWLTDGDYDFSLWADGDEGLLTFKRSLKPGADGFHYTLLSSPNHFYGYINRMVNEVEAKRKKVEDLIALAERQYNSSI